MTYLKNYGEYRIQILTDEYLLRFMSFFAYNLEPENLLAYSIDFIKNQFFNKHLNSYNFLIAVDNENNSIIGALGFVDTLFYDTGTKKNNFVWLTNWLADKTKSNTAGLYLLYSIFDYKKGSIFGTVGNNEMSGAIYKRLDFNSGHLTQWVIVNNLKTEYSLLQGEIMFAEKYGIGGSITSYLESDFDNIEQGFPVKSKVYLENKYIKNPFYKYELYTISSSICNSDMEESFGVLVLKTERYKNASALRIVDFVGAPESFLHIGEELRALLREKDAEYIDFYCYGIDESILKHCGFLRNDMVGDFIAPCYFEPFRQINVPIHFCYRSDRQFTVFKGDGDREFPRLLPQSV